MEDDEIIIGIDNIPNKKKSTKSKSKSKKKKNNSKNNASKNSSRIGATKNTSKNDKNKNSRKSKVLKFFGILILLIALIILILSSSIFNIKTISVEGNENLSDDKIISLSSLELYTNIFKFSKSKISQNIEENAYIENVSISRKLPSTVEITVKERTINYMLQFADSYVYINNQGYMLEISNEKKDVPILIGFTTDLSNIKAGNRINSEDLSKMNMVIRIYENLKLNGLGDIITKIDISNEKNYTLILETEGKTVYLGDASDLNTRILCLQSILDQTSGKSGEIFLNVDLNSQRAYFRENTN